MKAGSNNNWSIDFFDEIASDIRGMQGILFLMEEFYDDWDDVIAFLIRSCDRMAEKLDMVMATENTLQ